jgi:ligand-binding sensor domain-containing protein
MKRSIAYTIFLLMAACCTQGQVKENEFEQFTIQQGLTDNFITSIVQDENGFVWIGTSTGLNRFDGSRFITFSHTIHSNSIPNSGIQKLKVAGKNELIVVTKEGLGLLNTNTLSSKNYFIPDTTNFSLYVNGTWDATQVKGTGYFVSTLTGFYLFDYAGHLIWRYDAYTPKDTWQTVRYGREHLLLPDNKLIAYAKGGAATLFNVTNKAREEITTTSPYHIFALREWLGKITDGNGNYYLAGIKDNHIYRYNFPSRKLTVSELPINAAKDIHWPANIFLLNDSLMAYTCASGGFVLLHINNESGKITGDSTKYFQDLACTYIFLDRENRLWVGTQSGLYMQHLLKPLIRSADVSKYVRNYISSPDVNDIYRKGDKLYVATASYAGITILNAKDFSFIKNIRLDDPFNPELNEVGHIIPFNKDTLWLGTRRGLVWFDTKSEKEGIVDIGFPGSNLPTITAEFEDSHGNIWIGVSESYTGTLLYNAVERKFKYFGSHVQPYNYPLTAPHQIVEDSYGNTWFGSRGVVRYNYQTNAFDTVINSFAGLRKQEDNILSMAADHEGNLWMITAGNGFLQYNIAQKKFTAYSAEQGLTNDYTRVLTAPINNKIFIAVQSDIDIFDLKTKTFSVYKQHEGVPIGQISTDQFYYDSAWSVLWGGFHSDIAMIPTAYQDRKMSKPNLLITDLTVLKDTAIHSPDSVVSLSYRQNDISISFTALNFDDPENTDFHYRLQSNESWLPIENQNSINLSNLGPGKYYPEIKISSSTSRWPDQVKRMTLIIRPPFWQTWWFIVIALLMVAGLIYASVRYRVRGIRQKANLDKLLGEYEMKALHTQMNPHFVFNCLNSIKEMILLNERENASRYLSRFAQLIRDTLDQSKQSFISLRSNIDYIKRYVEMEQTRFEDFQYIISFNPNLNPDEIKIPPMLIQPLVENAIWHGLRLKEGEKKLNIDFTAGDNQLICRIDDNGIGIVESLRHKNPVQHTSVGIANIRKRIELLNEKYRLNCSLTITDKHEISGNGETGTLAVLSVPLEVD